MAQPNPKPNPKPKPNPNPNLKPKRNRNRNRNRNPNPNPHPNQVAQPAAGWWRTAVVSQVGGKVNEGRCRLQYTSALDEQAEPSGAKEWRMLSELRPVPPPPPKDWLAAVRTNEVRDRAWP